MNDDTDPDSKSCEDSLEPIFESILNRLRRGESVSIEEFAERNPSCADEIRELLPAVLAMEGLCKSDAASAHEPRGFESSQALPFEKVGDYRILGCVGEGGMGVVFEAERASLSSRVALKMMHARYRSDSTYLKRFRQEAKAAASLHHTNIVSVFDFGEQQGICYYAMQFIEGQGLDRVLADVRRFRNVSGSKSNEALASTRSAHRVVSDFSGIVQGMMTGHYESAVVVRRDDVTDSKQEIPLDRPTRSDVNSDNQDRAESKLKDNTPGRTDFDGSSTTAVSVSIRGHIEDRFYQEVARIGAQVAEALHYAHQRGIVHRDIKPSNILLDGKGNAWITDFGLAKFEGDEDLSRSRDVVGTLKYMAPERFRGVSDKRCDIYALGATLYEMLALRPAFEGTDQLHLVQAICHDPPPSLRKIDRRIPRDLETIVLKAMAKEPEDRFDDAGRLADELHRFIEGRPIDSRPVPAPERLYRWARRNPIVAGLNVLAAALTITIAVVSSIAADRNARLARQLEGQRDIANRNLVQAYISEAGGHRLSRSVGQRFETLDAVRKAISLAPSASLSDSDRLALRNHAIAALALPDLRTKVLPNVKVSIRDGLALDDRWKLMAYVQGNDTVVVKQVSDGAELMKLPLKSPPSPGSNFDCKFSPDGRYLGVGPGTATETLRVFDLSNGKLVLAVSSLVKSSTRTWDFHPASGEIAMALGDGEIAVRSLPDGRELRRLKSRRPGSGNPSCLIYDPTGERIALMHVEGKAGLTVIRAADGHEEFTNPHPQAKQMAWNPHRHEILAISNDETVEIWNTRSGTMEARCGPVRDGPVVAFHPSGDWLVSRPWSGILHVWDARSGQRLLEKHTASSSPEFQVQKDGPGIGFETDGESTRLLELHIGDISAPVSSRDRTPADSFHALAVDPHGRHFVTLGSGGTSIWDLATRTDVARLPFGSVSWRVRTDADGSILTDVPSLVRWPVGHGQRGEIRAGPPTLLTWAGTGDGFDLARQGRKAILAQHREGAIVVDLDEPGKSLRLKSSDDAWISSVSISPDGRFAITGGGYVNADGTGITFSLWDLATGERSFDDPGQPGLCMDMSPDGRWLVLGKDGWILVDTITWKPAARLHRGSISGNVAFTPDSRVAAFDNSNGTIILTEAATGRELARLPDPDQARTSWLEFTPDGSKLLVAVTEKPFLRVWDIAAIRESLGTFDLDWDTPHLAETLPRLAHVLPLPSPGTVEHGGIEHLIATAPQNLQLAVKLLTERIAAVPEDSEAYKRRGRAFLAMGQFEEAFSDAEIALSKDAGNTRIRILRAECLGRLGRSDEALEILNEVLRIGPTDIPALLRRSQIRKARGEIRASDEDIERIFAIDQARGVQALNDMSWDLLTRPKPGRDDEFALDLARKAAAAMPDHGAIENTLALALVRTGKPREALALISENSERKRTRTEADRIVEATALLALGNPVEARKKLDEAGKSRQHALADDDLGRLRTELEAALSAGR